MQRVLGEQQLAGGGQPQRALPLCSALFALLCLLGTPATAQTFALTPTADTDVRENSGGDNFCGACTTAVARNHATGEYRPVYRFDLSGLPSGSRLISATLRLWPTDSDSGTVNLYRVTTDWSEATATWATTGGMAHNTTVRASFSPASTGRYYDVNLTALVAEWLSGTPNYGVLLRTGSYSAYTTKEWGTSTQRPQLVVVVTPPPNFTATKATTVVWDPVNAAVNPKRIPGAVLSHDLTISNSSTGWPDANTVVIVEAVPSQAALFVGDIVGAGSGPVRLTQGTPSSNLTYSYLGLANTSDDLEFSADGGLTYLYDPSANAGGYDSNVTHVRLRPKGTFAPASGAGAPNLTFTMRLRAN